MRHSSKIVNFCWANICNNGNKICCITKISVVKEELNSGLVSVFVNVIDTSSVEYRSTTDDSVNLLGMKIILISDSIVNDT